MAWNQREIEEWKALQREVVALRVIVQVVEILAERGAQFPTSSDHYIGSIRAVAGLTRAGWPIPATEDADG